MSVKETLKARMKAGRKRGALWVRLLDFARTVATPEGRSLLWTKVVDGPEVHQTTPYTCEERYPELFDLAARLAPASSRILSFGCSTGEELDALRRRFPNAEIVGAEINRRSRRIASRRMASDDHCSVVDPRSLEGHFDLVFALAVLQREPQKVAELGFDDLSGHYPFERFDNAAGKLAASLNPGGLLCVFNAHYRIEDSSAAKLLEPVTSSPGMDGPLFGPDGCLLKQPTARSLFRKL